MRKMQTNLKSAWVRSVLLIAFVLFSGLALYTATAVGQIGGAGLIDTAWNYTPDQAHQILTGLGSSGRLAYLNWLALDAVYLVVYTLFFLYSASCFLPRLISGPAARWLMVVPILPGAFDAAEDVCIWVMLRIYPVRLDGMTSLCNGFTMLKDVTFYACLLGLIVLFVAYRRQPTSPQTAQMGPA